MAQISLFRRVVGDSNSVGSGRLNDQEVACLVKKTALTSGIRGDLPEIERGLKFARQSLRAGITSSVEVQKQLGHASAEMTGRYQRRRVVTKPSLSNVPGVWWELWRRHAPIRLNAQMRQRLADMRQVLGLRLRICHAHF